MCTELIRAGECPGKAGTNDPPEREVGSSSPEFSRGPEGIRLFLPRFSAASEGLASQSLGRGWSWVECIDLFFRKKTD